MERGAVLLPWQEESRSVAFTVDDVLSAEECNELMERATECGWKPSPMAPFQSGLRSRFDDRELSLRIFGRLQPVLPAIHSRRSLVGLTPTFRFVRYKVGCEVLPHPDTAGGDAYTPVSDPCSSHFTVLLYLNDGYDGCETHFLPKGCSEDWPGACESSGIRVEPKAGRALIFEHGLLHGCPPLVSGEKYVCRVDVAYGDVDVETGLPLKNEYRDSTLSKKENVFAKARRNLRTSLADKIRANQQTATTTSLRGRGAVVTGGSSGIGLELCRALAANEGMTVVSLSRTPPPPSGDINILWVKVDLAQTDDPTQALDKALDLLEQTTPAVLVNNAGFSTKRASVLDGNAQDCEELFKCNTLAPLHLTRHFINHLRRRKIQRCHVVYVSSLSAHRIQNPNLGLYAATKAALHAIAETTRLELARLNLPSYRVSLVSPGLAETRFYDNLLSSPEKSDAFFANSRNTLQPSDVVDAILYALNAPARVQVHDILIRPNHTL